MEKLKKILIADDNTEYRNSLARALKGDYEIDFASNAKEEIEKAKKNEYEIIITDNNMEDGHSDSGLYAIEQIRKAGRKTPIFLSSASLSEEVKKKAKALGADEIVGKPLSLKDIKEKIAKYSHKRS